MIQVEAQLLRDAKAWNETYELLSKAVTEYPDSRSVAARGGPRLRVPPIMRASILGMLSLPMLLTVILALALVPVTVIGPRSNIPPPKTFRKPCIFVCTLESKRRIGWCRPAVALRLIPASRHVNSAGRFSSLLRLRCSTRSRCRLNVDRMIENISCATVVP